MRLNDCSAVPEFHLSLMLHPRVSRLFVVLRNGDHELPSSTAQSPHRLHL